MEQSVEYFANLVFYHLFRFEKLTQRIISEPFLLLLKLPVVDRSYKRRGVENAEEVINKALYDPKRGFNIVQAGWHLTLLFGLIISGTAFFLISSFLEDFNLFEAGDMYYWLFVLATFIPAWIASEIFVERKRKYLKYFKQFERKSEQWHFRTGWITFFTVIGIWGYAIGGVAFYLGRL